MPSALLRNYFVTPANFFVFCRIHGRAYIFVKKYLSPKTLLFILLRDATMSVFISIFKHQRKDIEHPHILTNEKFVSLL